MSFQDKIDRLDRKLHGDATVGGVGAYDSVFGMWKFRIGLAFCSFCRSIGVMKSFKV